MFNGALRALTDFKKTYVEFYIFLVILTVLQFLTRCNVTLHPLLVFPISATSVLSDVNHVALGWFDMFHSVVLLTATDMVSAHGEDSCV